MRFARRLRLIFWPWGEIAALRAELGLRELHYQKALDTIAVMDQSYDGKYVKYATRVDVPRIRKVH